MGQVVWGQQGLIPGVSTTVELDTAVSDLNKELSVAITGIEQGPIVTKVKFNEGKAIVDITPDMKSTEVKFSIQIDTDNFIVRMPIKLFVGEPLVFTIL